jgi:hypothetical protein
MKKLLRLLLGKKVGKVVGKAGEGFEGTGGDCMSWVIGRC